MLAGDGSSGESHPGHDDSLNVSQEHKGGHTGMKSVDLTE